MAVLSAHTPRPARLARSLSGALSAFAAVVLALALPHAAFAQAAASEAAVKAAFVYNFAKFTEWPASAFANREAPLVLCIPSTLDPALAQAFGAVEGKTAQARTIRLRRIARFDEAGACHIVYATESDVRRAPEALRALSGKPVLTVSDSEAFADTGGMIGLFSVDNRIQFEINVEATQHAGLTLSSQLLRLARIVKDPRRERR